MKPLRIIGAALLAALAFQAQAVGRVADVSIYDRTAGRQLPVYWHEGRAYVVGEPGNEYQVTVRNRRGEDVLAVISVDGVNVMNGETAGPYQSGYIVSPWRRVDIRGWRKSMDDVASFYFTSLGDSYAARTDRPQNVGVIGVALFERKRYTARIEESTGPFDNWLKREQPQAQTPAPADSARAKSSGSTAAPSAPLGTGHGRREESHITWVDFDRADAPAETITIYYDSYRNLVARGILPQPYYGRRDPDPFPNAGFAPDPWR
jgi:hypothetical protein